MAQASISLGVGKSFCYGMLEAAMSLARSETYEDHIWRPCMDNRIIKSMR
jgi:hypothetical protein